MKIPLKNNYQAITLSPVGPLGVRTQAEYLIGIDFLAEKNTLKATTSFSLQVIDQLKAYFQDPHFHFSIPYRLKGSTFQKKVWQALIQIPVGITVQYGELARQLKTGARAIGSACRSNPLPIILPCHRIVSGKGLGGYCGTRGLEYKQWLLEHEAPFDLR